MRVWVFAVLLSMLACAPEQGPVEQAGVWEVDGLVLERRGEDTLLIRADDGTSVLLDVPSNAEVKIEAQEVPSIRALFEGDRVRATWTGEPTRGHARDVVVTRPNITAQRMSKAKDLTDEPANPDWMDTMDSPGGTMNSPWYVGTWDYQQPGRRDTPPAVNPVTGEVVPSDERPSF